MTTKNENMVVTPTMMPVVTLVPILGNYREKPKKFNSIDFKRW